MTLGLETFSHTATAHLGTTKKAFDFFNSNIRDWDLDYSLIFPLGFINKSQRGVFGATNTQQTHQKVFERPSHARAAALSERHSINLFLFLFINTNQQHQQQLASRFGFNRACRACIRMTTRQKSIDCVRSLRPATGSMRPL
jgi:hypothetical protein